MPVTPLLEAAEAYPAMERLVLQAERSVWMAFRIFDPQTKLRSQEAEALGLADWSDLIGQALDRGVTFHIRLTDFDPAGGPSLHRLCWRSTSQLRAIAQGRAGTMTVFPAMHPHTIGPLPSAIFWPVVRHRLSGALDVEPSHYEPPDYQVFRASGSVPLWPPHPVRPATHHEKIIVADGTSAILGGLDLNERRFDTEDHNRPADQTWHDVSLMLAGTDVAGCIADLHKHLMMAWVSSSTIDQSGEPEPLPAPNLATTQTAKNASKTSFIGTLSDLQEGTAVIAPKAVDRSIETTTLQLIRDAQELIYIETQFLRSRSIADAIAHALQAKPALNLIVVLPAAPDDVAFENNSGADARHGEWLQAKCIQTIRRAAGPRALLVSPVGATAPTAQASNADPDRKTVQQRWPIYVHSKVMITDMRRAIVSSANLNGRSMRWDTEAGVLWEDGAAVQAFQKRLLAKHLSGEEKLPDQPTAIEVMHAVRQGASSDDASLLARYPLRRARKFAAPRFFVPDDMV
jgi:phospholipase D1/2